MDKKFHGSISMARQPQVVTAVIRPCNSPVPNNTKRRGMAQHASIHAKSKSSESAQQQKTRPQPNSNASLKGNFAKPTASTLLKSRCPSNASSDRRTNKTSNTRAPVSPSKRKEVKNSSSNASAPVTMQKPRKPQLPVAARGGRTTSSSGRSQRSGTAASSTAGSTKQRSSPVSSRSGSPSKSASLSSRAPQTSSAGRKSSRISAASTRTRYPAMTSATSGSERRRSPSLSAHSACSHSSAAAAPRLVRSASHEARLNQLKDHIDHLRRTSPRIASPEFTSTRTNLAGRSRSPSPGRSQTADTSRWHLTGNSTALFASPRRPGCRPRSRSRSRSPGGAASAAARRRTGTTTWVETRNRASTLGAAGQAGSRASPPPTWQTKRHLPRVSYPRPNPATALRARSSSSQTRQSASGDERVTLQSRGGRHVSPSSRGSPHRPTRTAVSPRHPNRTPASTRRVGRTPANRPTRTPISSRHPNRTPASPRHPNRTPASPRAGRTPASRVAAPSTIDYSPQSRYMAGLLKQGAVRRPTGKENRRPGDSSGSESGRVPYSGSAGRQGYYRGSQREAGRRPSAASRRSAASEPVQSPRKPARSILRTSASSNPAASDPSPRHHGYSWVSDMLDLSAPLSKSKKDVQSARKFRDKNWSDTHGRGPGRGTTSGSCSSGQQRGNHKCVHEYYINKRLFPTPLYTDSEGRSQCPVCLAVGSSPAGPARRSPGAGRGARSRSRSPGASRGARSRSPGASRGACSPSPGAGRGSRSRSPSPGASRGARSRSPGAGGGSRSPGAGIGHLRSRVGLRSRSPTPARTAPFGTQSRRPRSRSPADSRAGRPRSRSGAAPRRRASLARQRSSVSWHDEVALASSAARSRTTLTSRTGRTGRTSRSRSPSGSVCVTCPNCHHQLPLSAAELSDALSESLESPRGRRAARGPAPAPSPPPRLEAARCPGEGEEEWRGRPSPAPAVRQRRSPVTLRSRAPTSRQPVKAMFTVPTALFHDAREECGSCTSVGGGGGVDWDVADSAGDLADPGRTRSGHPLWPRQLDLSPAGVRPIARGWPRQETRGNLGRPANPLQRAAIGQLQAGRNPAPRRSIQTSGSSGAKNTYSLRRCIGEKM